jgi:hypothetical protein
LSSPRRVHVSQEDAHSADIEKNVAALGVSNWQLELKAWKHILKNSRLDDEVPLRVEACVFLHIPNLNFKANLYIYIYIYIVK